jgi:peptide chain release factor subunit 1
VFELRHVRELAARRGVPLTTSFYLDIDGRRYPRPTDYASHVTELGHLARRRATALGQPAAAAVKDDLDRIHHWLSAGVDRTTARGVAVFSSARQGYFEPLLLPVPVRDQVSLEPGPNVTQLLEVLEQRQPTLAVLIDRRRGRFIRIEFGVAAESAELIDEPERAVDTDVEVGGWQHRREEATRRHARRVAMQALEEVRVRRPDYVVLGGPPDDVAALRAVLDQAVITRLVGTLSLSVGASLGDIRAAALGIIGGVEQRREDELVGRLHERAPVGAHAALGLPAVMAALAGRRVETLVVARGFRARGARCPACGHVGVGACQCPECGTPSVEVDDIVEVAINQSLAQDASVEFCGGTDLDAFGGVGAFERS